MVFAEIGITILDIPFDFIYLCELKPLIYSCDFENYCFTMGANVFNDRIQFLYASGEWTLSPVSPPHEFRMIHMPIS